jgi:hypothetical protein
MLGNAATRAPVTVIGADRYPFVALRTDCEAKAPLKSPI